MFLQTERLICSYPNTTKNIASLTRVIEDDVQVDAPILNYYLMTSNGRLIK